MQTIGEKFGWPTMLATGIVAAAIVLRIVLVLSPSFTLDADKGIVYLIAVRQSYGEYSGLFWGQVYGGTILSVVSGALMWVTTIRSPFILVGVTLLMTVLSGVVLWRLALRAFGLLAGLTALVVFLFPGAYLLRQSVDDGGFYASSILFALVGFWLAVDSSARRLPFWLRAGLVGLCVGIAFWCSPMGLALAAPAVVLLAIPRSRWKALPLAAAGFAVGALPLALAMLAPPSSAPSGAAATSTALTLSAIKLRGESLFFELLPAGLPGQSITPMVIGLLALALLIALVVLAVRDRTGLGFAFAAGAVLLTALLIESGNPLQPTSARYSQFYLPALSFAVAGTVGLLPRLFARIAGAALSIAAVTGTVVVFAAGMMVFTSTPNMLVAPKGTSWPSAGEKFGTDASLVSNYLESRHISAIWATYWLSYRIAAASDGSVTAADVEYGRFLPYRYDAESATPGVVVVPSSSAEDSALLSSTDRYSERVTDIGGTSIYFYDHTLSSAEVTAALLGSNNASG